MDCGIFASAIAASAGAVERAYPVPEGGVARFDHEKLDALERLALANPEALLFPGYVHRFVPGLYLREITMPGGVDGGYIHTTKIHKSHHAFVVLSGEAWVCSPEGRTLVRAGHVGETQPGTRRILWNFVECRWMTLHVLTPEEEALRRAGASEAELIAAVEARIIEWRELDGGRSAFEIFQEVLGGGTFSPCGSGGELPEETV